MTDQNDHGDQGENVKRPAATLRDGAVKATIWPNKGENGTYYATTLSRTYSDADGNTRDTNSFVGTDLLKAAELARSAYERTNELKREAFKEQRREEASSAQTREPDRQNDR